MPGPTDDSRALRRGAVRPPPSLTPDEAPAPVVPRMEPPPPSLEAMVQGNVGTTETGSGWRFWTVLLAIAAAVIGYVLR